MPPPPRECSPHGGPFTSRYSLLLPLRGLVALAVVLNHTSGVDLGARQGRVVLFFVISGYAIVAAAEAIIARSRLAPRPGEAMRFLRRRAVRIWPLYALSLVYLLIVASLWSLRDSDRNPGPPWFQNVLGRPATEWLSSLLLLDWTRLVIEPLNTPRPAPWRNPSLLVPAHWTLGYEVQFYALAAVGIFLALKARLRPGHLAIAATTVLAAAGACCAWVWPARTTGLLPDYSLCFAVGSLVYVRLCLVRRAALRWVIDLALAAAAIGFWTFARQGPVVSLAGPARVWFSEQAEVVSVASGFGLLLILLRRFSDLLMHGRPRIAMSPVVWLGTISYSLFLVHTINLPLMNALTRAVGLNDAARWIRILFQLSGHVALASAFWFVCERPLTRWTRSASSSPVIEGERSSVADAPPRLAGHGTTG